MNQELETALKALCAIAFALFVATALLFVPAAEAVERGAVDVGAQIGQPSAGFGGGVFVFAQGTGEPFVLQ